MFLSVLGVVGFLGFSGPATFLSVGFFLGVGFVLGGAFVLGRAGLLDVSPLFDGASFLDASTFLDASSFLAEPLWSPSAAVTFAVRLSFAATAPCETTTQFPKPAVVVNEARQRFLEVPPVHFVSAGIWTLSSCVPTAAGF